MTEPASMDSGAEVRRILIQSLGLDLASDELSDDTRLLDGGLGLDSLAGLRIILAIEQHFGFVFDVSDLSRESLESVGSLVALVDTRLSPGGSGSTA